MTQLDLIDAPRTFDSVPHPDFTPWGAAQHWKELGPGVWQCDTASHGGIWLSPQRLRLIPEGGRRFAAAWSHGHGQAWFEEDCAALQVIAAFPELFPHIPEADRENIARQAADYASRA